MPARGPGVFVVELPAPLPTAPLELTRIGKWIERVETLVLDGQRPTSKELAARLSAFWLPSRSVVYIGVSDSALAPKVAAMAKTPLGDRRPSSAGYWLHTLRSLETARVWWASTPAVEEYEDALLTAFADSVPAEDLARLHDASVVLPFANLRRPTGERPKTGITGALIAEPVAAPAPPTRVVQVPDGDADGARGEPLVKPARKAPVPRAKPATPRVAAPVRSAAASASTSVDGHARPAHQAGPPHHRGHRPAAGRTRGPDDAEATRRSSGGSGRPRSSATSRRTPTTPPREKSSRSWRDASSRSRPSCVTRSSSRRRRPAPGSASGRS